MFPDSPHSGQQWPRAALRPRAPAASKGQVLVITLLAMTLLVGLIFYVYNVGDQVNRRMAMQNAADAVAVSGAGWMGRSMNLLAMNNVTQSRMIALALVLDSLPLAAEMTVAEETGPDALPIALERQLNAGVPSTPLERNDFLRRGLSEIHRQMNRRRASQDTETHLDLIEIVDAALDQDDERQKEGGFNVKHATQWIVDGDTSTPPHGTIWQAAAAIDDLSQAVADSAGILAQSNAVQFGRADGARTAMLIPVLPRIPAYRGTFRDFEPVLSDYIRIVEDPRRDRFERRVVRSNLVSRLRGSRDILKEIERVSVRGGAIPDFAFPHRLGPFARVYKWRDHAHRSEGQWWEADYERLRIGYSTYGPLEHALRVVLRNFGQMGRRGGIAYTSRFPHHARRLAKLKLAYLLGLDYPKSIQYADKWMHDFEEAKQFARDNPDKVIRTRYYRVVVDSKVKWLTGRWLTGRRGEPREEKTFYSRQIHPDLADPITTQPLWRWSWEPWGWREPRGTKVVDHVWVRKYTRRVRDYRWFNWPPRPKLDPKGNIISGQYDMYTLYRVEWSVWGGMEIRDEVEVSNPIAGASEDELPAPFLLDTSMGDYDPDSPDPDEGVRRELFTFLGVAGRSNRARIWPQRFASQNPKGITLALAQAKLFNNQSWDLWTQDWQVELAPVSKWRQWAVRVGEGVDDAGDTGGSVRPEDVELVHEYMDNLPADMADLYLNH